MSKLLALRATAGACTLSLAVLVAESESRADEGDALLADRPAATPALPRWSVGFNPLALTIGRLSGDVEYLVLPHLGLVANVHGDYGPSSLPAVNYDGGAPVWGFGGEVGSRIYGVRNLSGIFLGASLVSGFYDVAYYGQRRALPDIGVAVDLGGKVRLGDRMFLTFGAGFQYLWTPRYPGDIAPGVSSVLGAGLDPRLLLTIGTVIR
jgi:hypothetical protein